MARDLDDPHRETNGRALFAFCAGLWIAIGVAYLGWRLLKWWADV